MIGRPSDVQIITKAINGDGYFVALMQEEGSGYKTILAHYYPGSQLMPRLAPQDFTDVR